MNITYKFFLGFAVLIMMMSAFAYSALAKTQEVVPTGYWLSKKKDVVVHIKSCETELCGFIHWIREDEQQFDINNPDPDLKGRSMCGIKVLWGLTPSGSKWKGGRIYKADDGEFFGAQVSMASVDLMELRGYIGMPAIGKTSPFTRVRADEYAKCTVTERMSSDEKSSQSRIEKNKSFNE